jgi:hypothetical protein
MIYFFQLSFSNSRKIENQGKYARPLIYNQTLSTRNNGIAPLMRTTRPPASLPAIYNVE